MMRTSLLIRVLLLVLPLSASAAEPCGVAKEALGLAIAADLGALDGFEALVRVHCRSRGADPEPTVFRLPAQASWLGNIPAGTQVVLAAGTGVSHLGNLPAGLQVFDGADTAIAYIGNLPAGVVVLGLAGTQVTHLGNLPSGLRALDVSRTGVAWIGNLPAGLEYLDVRGTPITSLTNLPAGIRCVVADPAIGGRNVVSNPRECHVDRELLRHLSR